MRAFLIISIGTVAIFKIFLSPFYGQVEEEEQIKVVEVAPLSLNFIRNIPSGQHNYSSGTLSADEIRQVLACRCIRTWIRMNGDGKDAGKISVAEERKIVEAAGVKFLFLNVHQIGIDQAARMIDEELNSGGVLLHCRHGYDRTGAMVGFHLRQNGWSRADVVVYNQWGWDYVKRKGPKYDQYWQMIN